MYKVLLVDDEVSVLDSEKRAIQNIEGFEVTGLAYSVEQAIEMINKERPDVILTDMKMHRASGIELIRYVSELEDSLIVCIAVSGYSDFDYVRESFLYGAFDYLLKPVTPEKYVELFSHIEKHLSERQKYQKQPAVLEPKLTGKQIVDQIDEYIHENLSKDVSILHVCGKFLISQPYLSKIFKTYKECTYNEYVNKIKIEYAKQYMKENYLIGEVAEMVGFADQFYFSKVFKAQTGYSPRDYRKKLGGGKL